MCYPRHETSLSSEESSPLQSHATGTFLGALDVSDPCGSFRRYGFAELYPACVYDMITLMIICR
jgi:hypothetical protein